MGPTTAQHIREAFFAGMWFLIGVSLWLYLSHRSADGEPTRWAKWKAFLYARYVVTSGDGGSERSRTGSAGGSGDPVRADTYQLEPAEPDEENEADPIDTSHNLDDKTLTLMLAAQKTRDGKSRWSANKIVEIVGGTRQEVLDTIAIVRPRETAGELPAQRPNAVVTPIAGRPSAGPFRSDDPAFVEQE